MQIQQKYEQIRNVLERHGQGHLLAFYDRLDAQQKQNLLAEIEQLDLPEIDRWIQDIVQNDRPEVLPARIEPAPSYPARPTQPRLAEKYDRARARGLELIKTGAVAAFVVAGGQGTRLGFDGPKGNYPISPVKKKTLFQLFAETIAATADRHNARPAWYVMTSPLNHKETVGIFEANNYYGLGKENVFIFQQGTLPNFSFDGRILLAEKHKVAGSPDGHGGSLKALYRSGAVEDMKKRGVKHLSYWQVDNPLVHIFDPLFIGLHEMDGSQMSSKALLKAHPKEKVGNFCLADGKVTVIEYSDLPDELAEKRAADDSLLFKLGSIGIHIISRDFVEKLNANNSFSLPLHRAVKKIPCVDPETGQQIKPEEPNGIKLETFVFDALPLADNPVILETIRSEEFAPVKNATGPDSAQVTEKMMTERAAARLENAGVRVPRKPDGTPDAVIEIGPGFALTPDELKSKTDQIPPIKPGDTVYLA